MQGDLSVRPNPYVGAVVVKEGRIVSEGYHRQYGGMHAEAEALKKAGSQAVGADLYCTLEPCSFHDTHKHNPPCTEAVIQAGISRVIIGQIDPNPKVRGQGVKILEKAGITVEVDDDDQFWYLNGRFNTYHSLARPFVTIKLAQSLDGSYASVSGDSKWITDFQARSEVHRQRAVHDVILIGISTALQDDPKLTVRLEENDYCQPLAAVVDTYARLPLSSYLVEKRAEEITLYTAGLQVPGKMKQAVLSRISELKKRGVRVVQIPLDSSGLLSLSAILEDIYESGNQSLYVEGGGSLAASFIQEHLFDQLLLYTAPILIGGDGKKLSSLGVEKISEAVGFEHHEIKTIGDQVRFRGFRKGWLASVKGGVQ